MELEILHAIQELHTDWLNAIMILVTTLGNGGIIWIALSLVLVVPKRTRVCGFTMMGAMLLSFLLGNLLLKNLIAKPNRALPTGLAFPCEMSADG